MSKLTLMGVNVYIANRTGALLLLFYCLRRNPWQFIVFGRAGSLDFQLTELGHAAIG